MASPVSQPLPPRVEGTVPNPGPSGSGLSPILTADEKMAYVLEKLERIQTQNAWLREKYDKLKMEAVGPSRAKEAHISLPDKFDGTRSLYRGFIGQVKNVICVQSSRYAMGRDRVGLIGSLLTKAAQSWFTPLVEKNSPVLDNYEEFLRQFEAIFGEHDRSRVAAQKIRNMRQANRSAATYAADFQQIQSELDWGDGALIDQFRSGLSGEVKDLMLTMTDPTTLGEVMAQAIRCDERLFERRRERRGEGGFRPVDHRGSTTPSTPSPIPQPLPPGEPMQLGGTRFKKLTDAEKERRRANNLCLYCGEPNHRARDCPKRVSGPRSAYPAHVATASPLSINEASAVQAENSTTQS